MPWGQVGDSLTAAQNPFLHTSLAGVSGRLQLDVPLQHAPPQFQASREHRSPKFYVSAPLFPQLVAISLQN